MSSKHLRIVTPDTSVFCMGKPSYLRWQLNKLQCLLIKCWSAYTWKVQYFFPLNIFVLICWCKWTVDDFLYPSTNRAFCKYIFCSKWFCFALRGGDVTTRLLLRMGRLIIIVSSFLCYLTLVAAGIKHGEENQICKH